MTSKRKQVYKEYLGKKQAARMPITITEAKNMDTEQFPHITSMAENKITGAREYLCIPYYKPISRIL